MSLMVVQDSLHLNESQMYDHLSLFIQIFKKLIASVENTAISLQKATDHIPFLDKIQSSLDQLNQLTTKNQHQSAIVEIQPITFHRFICRLLETLTLYRMRSQFASQHTSLIAMSVCLREIETIVKKFQEDKNLGRTVKLINISINKFRNSSINKNCVEIGSEVNNGNIKIAVQNKKCIIQRTRNGCESIEDCLQQEVKDKKQKQQSFFSNVGQVMSQLQRRFQVLKCLDLEMPTFKSIYFEAKSSKEDFYQDCMERNEINARLIATYYDDFNLYQKRKQNKKAMRQHRFISKNGNVKSFSRAEINRDKTKEKQIRNDLVQTEKKISREKDKEENQKNQSSKVSYKMSNVYMTLNKKNINNKVERHLSPKMSVKPSGWASNNSNSNGVTAVTLKSKMTFALKVKKSTRIKTEADRPLETKFLNALQSSQIEISLIKTPVKSMKSRYLQINCVEDNDKREKRETIGREKLIKHN